VTDYLGGDNYKILLIFGATILFNAIYWVVGGFLFALHFVPFFKKFKIQREQKVDAAKCLIVSY
jgi:hypothetical protein